MNKSTTSHNRAYLASCLRHSAQIPIWGTSDTLETLADIQGGENATYFKRKEESQSPSR